MNFIKCLIQAVGNYENDTLLEIQLFRAQFNFWLLAIRHID